MTSFLQKIDVFKRFPNGNNDQLISRINFASMLGSTALMCYLYRLSTTPSLTEKVWGGKDAPKMSRYLKYTAFLAAAVATYHFVLYPQHKMEDVEDKLNIPTSFSLSKQWRQTIAICIAVPSLIAELMAWKEVGMAPLDPDNQDFVGYRELFGGIYNYVRHPIYFCEFTWFYTLSLLLDSPLLLIASGVIFQPACYHMCKSDDYQLERQFGGEFKKYEKKTGFWLPKLF
eukprot:156970_1